MKKLFGCVLFLLLFAVPTFAQDSGCYDCKTVDTGEATYVFCGNPDNNSWGYDQPCAWYERNGVTICRRQGSSCYYFEVYG